MNLLLEAARDVTLAQKLKAYRLAAGLTQEQLARLAGPSVRTSTISRIESGQTEHPSYPTLKAIAHALGVEVEQLVDDQTSVEDAPPVTPLDDVEWLKAAAGKIMAAPPDEAYRKMSRYGRLSARGKKLIDDMLEELSRASGRMEPKRDKGQGGVPSEDDEPPDDNGFAGKPVAKDYDALPEVQKHRPRTRS